MLLRRWIVWALSLLGILGGGGSLFWAWLAEEDDLVKRVKKMVRHIFSPELVLDVERASEGTEGIVLEGVRLLDEGTEGYARRIVFSGDVMKGEEVKISGKDGILIARSLTLFGIDWARGWVRGGEIEDVAIVDRNRLGGIEATRARLLGWSSWLATRVEMDRPRLVIRGGRAAGLEVAATSAVVSLDPVMVGEGSLLGRWMRALSALALRGVSGTIVGQKVTMETMDVRWITRDEGGRPRGVEFRVTALDIGGEVAEWRKRLLYGRMEIDGLLRIVRMSDGAWRMEVGFSWPLAGEGEGWIEANLSDGIWPDLEVLRWRYLSVIWRDRGLVRRMIEQARAGRTTEETIISLAENLYRSPLLEGVVTARLDLERWLESPGVVRLEILGEGSAWDLARIVDLERPSNAAVRLSLR